MINPFIRSTSSWSANNYKQQYSFTIDDFSGGLNNVDNQYSINDNQVVDCKNMMFSDNFGMEKRYGVQYVDDVSFSKPIVFFDKFSDHTVIATSDELYVDNEKLFNVSGQVDGCFYNGCYYVVDGKNLFEIYFNNGLPEYSIIIEDPKVYIDSITANFIDNYYKSFEIVSAEELSEFDSSLEYYADPYGTIRLSSTDVNSNNYKIYYYKKIINKKIKACSISSFKVHNVPPNVSVGDLFTFADNSLFSDINYNAEPRTDEVLAQIRYFINPEVVSREFVITRIWQDVIEFEPVYEGDNILTEDDISDIDNIEKMFSDGIYHLTMIRCYKPLPAEYVDGNPSYKDNYVWYEPCQNELEYGYLGENYIPECPTNICTHDGRLYITDNGMNYSEVRACNPNNPYYFPSALSLSVTPDGEQIIDMFSFDGALILARHKDMWVVRGSSTNDEGDLFRINKMDTTTGVACRHCGSLVNNVYLFLGYDGLLYKLTTPNTNVEYLMVKPLTTYIDLRKKPFYLTEDDFFNCSSVSLYNTIYWLIGNVILVYDYNKMAFTYWTGINASILYTDQKDLYFGMVDGTKTKLTEGVYNDCGKPIISKYQTKYYNLNSPVNYKYFEQIKITLQRFNSVKSTVNLKVYYDDDAFVKIKDRGNYFLEASTFNQDTWNETRFASRPVYKTNWLPLNIRSITISLCLENRNIDETFKFIDMTTIYTNRDFR